MFVLCLLDSAGLDDGFIMLVFIKFCGSVISIYFFFLVRGGEFELGIIWRILKDANQLSYKTLDM